MKVIVHKIMIRYLWFLIIRIWRCSTIICGTTTNVQWKMQYKFKPVDPNFFPLHETHLNFSECFEREYISSGIKILVYLLVKVQTVNRTNFISYSNDRNFNMNMLQNSIGEFILELPSEPMVGISMTTADCTLLRSHSMLCSEVSDEPEEMYLLYAKHVVKGNGHYFYDLWSRVIW